MQKTENGILVQKILNLDQAYLSKQAINIAIMIYCICIFQEV